eukprot:5125710-Pyramimonas_sp.AAC.1
MVVDANNKFAREGPVPDWVRRVCAHRQMFAETALVFRSPTGIERYLLVVHAMQNPLFVNLMELRREPRRPAPL